jgi:hypothetical protein
MLIRLRVQQHWICGYCQAVAHGSIQAAASWPKLNGPVNALDGAGAHPGLSLIVAGAFAASARMAIAYEISELIASAARSPPPCDQGNRI